jgi:transcriptional regulator with XRE-family HTH domain
MGKHFTTRVREARERDGHTQADLAEKFDVTAATVCHWENGVSQPGGETRRRVEVWLEEAEKKRQKNREKSIRPRPHAHQSPDSESKESVGHEKGLKRDVLVTALADLPDSDATRSSPANQGWQLEQVTVSRGRHFTVKGNWAEAKIEEHLSKKWSQVNFGQVGELLLLGRQVRLKSTTREKVDFVARTVDGRWMAVEIKCKDATDLTQLLSYMRDLAFSLKLPPEKVGGILLAPNFGEKVLNAAADNTRVTLLRFHRKA